jgi:stringent starvation protein B
VEPSTRPYLIRAIYEWCGDNGYTPYISVRVDAATRVPMEYVKNGEIVLNISQEATRNITLGRDVIQFSARFNGVSREISIPVSAIAAIFAKENGQGLVFPPEDTGRTPDAPGEAERERPQAPDGEGGSKPDGRGPGKRPRLQIVK